MKTKIIYSYDANKNATLIAERGIGFEEIIERIEEGWTVAKTKHPNAAKYPHQWVYEVDIDGYIYVVPFVTNGKTHFLKTIYASRKSTKKYLDKENKQ